MPKTTSEKQLIENELKRQIQKDLIFTLDAARSWMIRNTKENPYAMSDDEVVGFFLNIKGG